MIVKANSYGSVRHRLETTHDLTCLTLICHCPVDFVLMVFAPWDEFLRDARKYG